MDKRSLIGHTEISSMLFATLLLRCGLVVYVFLALPARITLPLWMMEWYQRLILPLFLLNFLAMFFHKRLADFFEAHPGWLYFDLLFSMTILMIGGGWRSSYFLYTMTTIMLFAIFYDIRGAFVSSIVLAVTSFIKDPSGGLPDIEIFNTTKLDMRLGASFAYIMTGSVLWYIRILLKRIENLAKRINENDMKVAALEEKKRLSMELHDGAKQIAMAMIVKMSLLMKQADKLPGEISAELHWFWRGLNYLQSELGQVVTALKSGEKHDAASCCVKTIVRDEARIMESMTGFSWEIVFSNELPVAPMRIKEPLRRFLTEALMNAWKHSGKMKGVIEVGYADGFIQVVIVDQGKGFTLPESDDIRTTGLKSLRFRAGELKAGLRIETAPDKGCKVILILPTEGNADS